ncbi:hypothetical protein DH2020_002747 [Rehmannia glutinosa]|uniref:Uncharacterized protein n=1 Tax=Rehmannia glutinosa TaxID=99300 RepID=A0ABR0XUL8_REHGL
MARGRPRRMLRQDREPSVGSAANELPAAPEQPVPAAGGLAANFAREFLTTLQEIVQQATPQNAPNKPRPFPRLRLTTYREIVESAQIVSSRLNLEQAHKPQELTDKKRWNPQQKGKFVPPRKKFKPAGAQTLPNKPLCPTCNKNHYGECLMGKRLCFK